MTTDERPWRVLTFEPRDDGLEATLINGHEIARQNGKYKIRQYRKIVRGDRCGLLGNDAELQRF